MDAPVKGKCLCGSIRFTVDAVGGMEACHCEMCRRWAGSMFIDVSVKDGDLRFESDSTLAWYESSEHAQRAFCSACGSSLFFRMKLNGAPWGVLAGTLDLPNGLEIGEEVFIDKKPDYYALAGERPHVTSAEMHARLREALK